MPLLPCSLQRAPGSINKQVNDRWRTAQVGKGGESADHSSVRSEDRWKTPEERTANAGSDMRARPGGHRWDDEERRKRREGDGRGGGTSHSSHLARHAGVARVPLLNSLSGGKLEFHCRVLHVRAQAVQHEEVLLKKATLTAECYVPNSCFRSYRGLS